MRIEATRRECIGRGWVNSATDFPPPPPNSPNVTQRFRALTNGKDVGVNSYPLLAVIGIWRQAQTSHAVGWVATAPPVPQPPPQNNRTTLENRGSFLPFLEGFHIARTGFLEYRLCTHPRFFLLELSERQGYFYLL